MFLMINLKFKRLIKQYYHDKYILKIFLRKDAICVCVTLANI